MGVPLTSFTVLKYIADGLETKQQSTEMELALDSLKEYSVFAFVLHDPKVHTEFHQFFVKQFENLHYNTGENLVFFGLVDSSKNLTLEGRKPFYTDVRDMINLYEEEQNYKMDKSYSAFALAQSLKIEPDMLPAIIVTNDTRLKSFRYYKTCQNELEKQMSRLQVVSLKMYKFKKSFNKDLAADQQFLFDLLDEQELDLCRGQGNVQLNESMARALSDMMSFIIQESDDLGFSGQNVKRVATYQKKASLNKVMLSLSILKKNMQTSDLEDIEFHNLYPLIEELHIKFAMYLKMMEEHSKKHTNILINTAWLEDHSTKLLLTGLEVANYIEKSQRNLDYSSSAICLAKMFEKEINYSFVHWIRKQNGIQLPEYYNQYQPGVRALVTTNSGGNSTHVDVNNNKHGKWLPPELGKSKFLARNLTEGDWKSIGVDDYKLFTKEWDIIHRIRNLAAHTEEVTFEDFNKMKTALIRLENGKVLGNLSNLKYSFKVGKTIPPIK